MYWADSNPAVLRWASEETVVPYFSPVDLKMHRYFPDFLMEIKTNSGEIKRYMVEIKPEYQTLPPKGIKKNRQLLEATKTYSVNMAKWKAAAALCQSKGFQFIVLTEKHLNI
jgi:hypothetical protein